MKCVICGGTTSTFKYENYNYQMSGLSKVFLHGVTGEKCAQCGEIFTSIPHPLELHDLLASDIASQPSKLSGNEIRFLRTHLGFSGADFARKIGVTPETVSRWEKGALNMKDTAEKLLRVLVLAKVEPFRNYDMLDSLASKPTKKTSQRVLKINKSKWQLEKVA